MKQEQMCCFNILTSKYVVTFKDMYTENDRIYVRISQSFPDRNIRSIPDGRILLFL